MVAIGGAAAVLVATVPASAFYSGSDPDSYYRAVVTAVNAHRGWEGTRGIAFESVEGFTPRLPDDEFDDILLNLVNDYRGAQGLVEVTQFESLRVQSAMWSNRLADAGTTELADNWYTADAVVACDPLEDITTTSGLSGGRPQDVFDGWLADPAARNALLAPDAQSAGIATVAEGGQYYTTMRLADGSCPGGTLPYRAEPTGLPTPKLRVHLIDRGAGLAIHVNRPGQNQQRVEVQRADYYVWRLWRSDYVQPRRGELRVHPPGGRYRVVVPAQDGYDVAISPIMDVAGPPMP